VAGLKSHLLAGFRLAPFRLFAPKTRLYDMAKIRHHTALPSSCIADLNKMPTNYIHSNARDLLLTFSPSVDNIN